MVVEGLLADERFAEVRETCPYMWGGEAVLQAEGRLGAMINSFTSIQKTFMELLPLCQALI